MTLTLSESIMKTEKTDTENLTPEMIEKDRRILELLAQSFPTSRQQARR